MMDFDPSRFGGNILKTSTKTTMDTLTNDKNMKNYYLNLAKEACVFTMIAYSLFNEFMMATFGPLLVLPAILFMFIPRNIILGKEGSQCPTQMRALVASLNIIKFISLTLMTAYIFLNPMMTELFGTFLLWLAVCFMATPRKLIKNLVTFSEKVIN